MNKDRRIMFFTGVASIVVAIWAFSGITAAMGLAMVVNAMWCFACAFNIVNMTE